MTFSHLTNGLVWFIMGLVVIAFIMTKYFPDSAIDFLIVFIGFRLHDYLNKKALTKWNVSRDPKA